MTNTRIMPNNNTYSNPDLARRIAKTYGKEPVSVSVIMKGSRDVSSLLERVNQAKQVALKTSWQLD